jgi:BNR repeat-like domain
MKTKLLFSLTKKKYVMGAAISSYGVTQQPTIKSEWLLHYEDSLVKYASHASLETFVQDGVTLLALAYQASEAPYEGSTNQHLRFALSKDGGETWTPNRVIMFGLGPIWSPVLFYHKFSARLYLFYSESRKAFSPGGDIKCIYSTDAGATWSAPLTIYTHEEDGEVPKVVSNRPALGPDGTWYLPFHTEPVDSHKVFNAKSWCALQEAGDRIPTLPTPPAAAVPQGLITSAGVLVSKDNGASWKVQGHLEDSKTWLIQPTIDVTSKGELVMLFRTSMGKIYTSRSTDRGQTWTPVIATSLQNPNSKFSSLTIDNQMLLAHHPSTTSQSTLILSLSVDDGKRWERLCTVEEEVPSLVPKAAVGGSIGALASSGSAVGGIGGNPIFCNPCINEWAEDTVLVVYTVWGKGLKLATLKLATID